jgi:transcriptional regulator with PAS, ATPase and Fis domain
MKAVISKQTEFKVADRLRSMPTQQGEIKPCNEACALDKFNGDQPTKASVEKHIIQFAHALQPVINFDLICIAVEQAERLGKHDIYVACESPGDYYVLDIPDVSSQLNITEREYRSQRKFYELNSGITQINGLDFKKHRMNWPLLKNLSNCYNLESAMFFTVDVGKYKVTISFFSEEQQGYLQSESKLLNNLRSEIQQGLVDILDEGDSGLKIIKTADDSPSQNNYNQSSITGIIGSSPELLSVLDQLKIVAPSAISVLITGESGTGKERLAEAVHELSPRKGKPFIIVNCAALPAALVESELFGHEKGAFTGAMERRIGKFEFAEGGTIFLDEIGEMPMESQVKLLRVLQSKEIERLGGNQRKKVDVRIIAATNRNLEKEVLAGRFRLDLYYRLNVFPLDLPPLRRRKSDLPALVGYYAELFAKMNGKQTPSISPAALNQMMGYSWPGNIRELAHLMERNVLLCQGAMITEISLPKQIILNEKAETDDSYVKSFDENEREHILSVLKRCYGRIAGEGGAAELLKVPPTTLTSKIKRLGILRQHIPGRDI